MQFGITRFVAVGLALTSALPAGLVARADSPSMAPASASAALPPLPEGSRERGVAGVEASAVRLAAALGAVETSPGGDACDDDDLAVRWEDPGDGFAHGAHVTPIGPAPTAGDREVNGIVVCGERTHAYMGFEANWANGRWEVTAVPDIEEGEGFHGGEGDDHGDEDAHDEDAHDEGEGPAAPVPASAPAPPVAGTTDGPIEGYAPYEPQRVCDPSAKPGTVALRNLLVGRYEVSRSMGISRDCGAGGRSEHKEGRAFDWGVNVSRPAERAAADAFIESLMATDAAGNAHALARRMGVMYVIWNRQIWSSYRPQGGWRPYTGPSAHTDHVHVSLSWAGAQGRTSYWSGKVDPSAVLAEAPGGGPSNGRRATPASASTGERRARVTPAAHVQAADQGGAPSWKERKAARADGRGRAAAVVKEARDQVREDRRAEQAARKAARQEEAAAKKARWAEKKAEKQARWEAEKARKAAAHEAKAGEGEAPAPGEPVRLAGEAAGSASHTATREAAEAEARMARQQQQAAKEARRQEQAAAREQARMARQQQRAAQQEARQEAKAARRAARAAKAG